MGQSLRDGVPRVYGLFEDLEGALVMSHAGDSLWDRRPNKKADPPAVSPEQRCVMILPLTDKCETSYPLQLKIP